MPVDVVYGQIRDPGAVRPITDRPGTIATEGTLYPGHPASASASASASVDDRAHIDPRCISEIRGVAFGSPT